MGKGSQRGVGWGISCCAPWLQEPKGDCQGWAGSCTHGCGAPGTQQAPPVLQESEDDDEEEEEEEDDDEDEDDDDDNGDSSEEGGDSSESSSEEESEDGDEVRPWHREGTGPPSPSPGAGGHLQPGSDRSVVEEPPGKQGDTGRRGSRSPRCSRGGHEEQPRGVVRSSLGT